VVRKWVWGPQLSSFEEMFIESLSQGPEFAIE
jgi:hypothetical protein